MSEVSFLNHIQIITHLQAEVGVVRKKAEKMGTQRGVEVACTRVGHVKAARDVACTTSMHTLAHHPP